MVKCGDGIVTHACLNIRLECPAGSSDLHVVRNNVVSVAAIYGTARNHTTVQRVLKIRIRIY
jgi:hypothetical protein